MHLMRQTIVEPTPERLARDQWDWVNPAEIDSSEQPIGRTRRVMTSRVDRLYAAGSLTWTQWHAADWYRRQHYLARFGSCVTSSYGDRVSGGDPTSGLPSTERQYKARRLWREAREAMPVQMVGFIDRLVLHDEMPSARNRAGQRMLIDLRIALDTLAIWLQMPNQRTRVLPA